MKRIFSLASIMLLMLQVNLFAQNDNDNNNDRKKTKYEFVKTRSFSRSYNVGNDKLSIQNSFGKVEIRTWSKNEVKVDVSIETSSNVESVAQRIIDGININSNQGSNEVTFRTEIKGNNNGAKNKKSSMTIDYLVYMPASSPLKVVNEFGATIIPDLKGEVNLTSKFGSLKAGALSSIKNILVEFGKGTFESITNGNVVMKYSKAEFSKLVGNVKLNFEFCSTSKVSFDNSVSALDIKASYSTVNLRPVGDPSANYSISTSFGSFKNRTSIKFDGDDDDDNGRGPKFDHNYNGRSGSGSIPVKLTTSFGKIVLGEPTAEDLEKEKAKEKRRSKTA